MTTTTFDGPLQVGLGALTSGASSIAPVVYSRRVRITGATSTQTVVLPANVECLDSNLYIQTAGSAAASDDIVVSANGGTTMITYDAIGSAAGLLKATGTLGIVTVAGSAGSDNILGNNSETTLNIVATKSDAASEYELQLLFTRARDVK